MKMTIEILEDVNSDELLSAWNEFCYSMNWDDEIHQMNELDDKLENYSPFDIARMVNDSDFDSYAEYFSFNNYDLISYDDAWDAIDADELVDYINEHIDYFMNDSYYSDMQKKMLEGEE